MEILEIIATISGILAISALIHSYLEKHPELLNK